MSGKTRKIDHTIHAPIDGSVSQEYAGAYVLDLRDVVLASLMAKTHVSMISKPGWGKSEIPHQMAKQICGEDHFKLISMAPSTSPAVIDGHVDNEQFIRHGKYVINKSFTPYDEQMHLIIADELFRSNDPAYDSWLHASDPLKQDHSVVIATSNFIAKGLRVKALIDRFPFWYFLGDEILDVNAVISAQMAGMANGGRPKVPGWQDFPTWAEIEDVRSAKPGMRAFEAVVEYVDLIGRECAAAQLDLHPRQIAHWRKIVYFNAVWHTGQADFDSIPTEATRCMRWAWPAQDQKEARDWEKLIMSIVDPVQAVIDAVMANAVTEFKRIAGIKDDTDRWAESGTLGRLISDSQSSLMQVADSDDERVKQAQATLTMWMSDALNGNPPKAAKASK